MNWLFEADLKVGRIKSPFDISDVWTSSYSSNTNEIMWGAKFAARCPWITCVVRLSSYECGMDQPTYTPVAEDRRGDGHPLLQIRRSGLHQARGWNQDSRRDHLPLPGQVLSANHPTQVELLVPALPAGGIELAHRVGSRNGPNQRGVESDVLTSLSKQFFIRCRTNTF